MVPFKESLTSLKAKMSFPKSYCFMFCFPLTYKDLHKGTNRFSCNVTEWVIHHAPLEDLSPFLKVGSPIT